MYKQYRSGELPTCDLEVDPLVSMEIWRMSWKILKLFVKGPTNNLWSLVFNIFIDKYFFFNINPLFVFSKKNSAIVLSSLFYVFLTILIIESISFLTITPLLHIIYYLSIDNPHKDDVTMIKGHFVFQPILSQNIHFCIVSAH